MEDSKIIELYWQRDEQALAQTQEKYGRYCHAIAYNILYSESDSEECVNDTYLNAWNSMPPKRPDSLSAYLGRIVRNIALDRYDRQRAQKRCGITELALDELGECISDTEAPPSDDEALKKAINSFLASLPRRTRIAFMQRYWYACSISDIAVNLEMSESNVKVTLLRARERFKKHLDKEGIVI